MTTIQITREDEKATVILKAIRLIDEGGELEPVVRCRDCKLRSQNTPDGFHWCNEHERGSLCDDDYCSYGVRRE